MRYWITGASGTIGSAVVRFLAGEPATLIVRDARKLAGVSAAHDVVEWNLARDDAAMLPLPKEDVVLIALASRISSSTNPADLRDVLECDTLGHLRLMARLGDRVRAIVYASSGTVYGWPGIATEETPLAPQNVYALNKVAMERALSLARNIRVAILRIAQVYGPGAPHGAALYRFLDAAVRRRPAEITTWPDTVRDYCHVDDVATAIVLAARGQFAGLVNIGSGTPATLVDLARIAGAVAGTNIEPTIVSPSGPRTDMLLDITRAGRDLGWTPRVAIRNGLALEFARLAKA